MRKPTLRIRAVDGVGDGVADEVRVVTGVSTATS